MEHRASRLELEASFALPALLCLCMVAAGCSEELGPEKFETTRVSGRVQLGGKPVTGGFVDMLPVGGTRGLLRSTRIRPDGHFEMDRVPVGVVAIRIVGAPIPVEYARLFSSFPTRIQRTTGNSLALAGTLVEAVRRREGAR